MNPIIKDRPEPGYREVIDASSPLELLGFGLLRLTTGMSWTREAAPRETCLVVLSGSVDVTSGKQTFTSVGKRKGVFAGRPDSVFLPAGQEGTVTALNEAEVAVVSAASEREGAGLRIAPEDTVQKHMGKDNWQRDASIIVGPAVEAEMLFLGEAIVPGGNWASYPPHRHDKSDPPTEVDMEEFYFFKFNPSNGFGVQIMYNHEPFMDQAMNVHNNDTTVLPFGYHPVVTAPGYDMYYLWVMAGRDRQFLQTPDPDHAWVAEA